MRVRQAAISTLSLSRTRYGSGSWRDCCGGAYTLTPVLLGPLDLLELHEPPIHQMVLDRTAGPLLDLLPQRLALRLVRAFGRHVHCHDGPRVRIRHHLHIVRRTKTPIRHLHHMRFAVGRGDPRLAAFVPLIVPRTSLDLFDLLQRRQSPSAPDPVALAPPVPGPPSLRALRSEAAGASRWALRAVTCAWACSSRLSSRSCRRKLLLPALARTRSPSWLIRWTQTNLRSISIASTSVIRPSNAFSCSTRKSLRRVIVHATPRHTASDRPHGARTAAPARGRCPPPASRRTATRPTHRRTSVADRPASPTQTFSPVVNADTSRRSTTSQSTRTWCSAGIVSSSDTGIIRICRRSGRRNRSEPPAAAV